MPTAKDSQLWIQVKVNGITKKMLAALVADETAKHEDQPSNGSVVVRALIREEFSRRGLTITTGKKK